MGEARRLLLAAPLALGLAACGVGAALDGLVAGPRIMVAAVSAGDRLTARDGLRVKLAGVEAPGGAEPYAAEARDALARLARGRPVELLSDGAASTAAGEGVFQARLVQGRRWVEGALLDIGAVRVRQASDDRALAAEMLAREAAARRSGRGLWALAAYRVRLPEEVDGREAGLVLVEGRIRRVLHAGDGVELLFDDGFDRVSGLIPRRALREFHTARFDPDLLEGRLVRLRGTVRADSGHPSIDLDVPEQVERLEGR